MASSFEVPPTEGLPEAIQRVLNKFLGDPRLGDVIGQGLTPHLAPYMRGSVVAPGFQGFGTANSLFGHGLPDVGSGAYFAMNQQAMRTNMQSTQMEVNRAMQEQAAAVHRMMGNTNAVADSNNLMSVTNLVSRMQFNMHRPVELMRGMEEAQRFMGAGQGFGLSAGSTTLQASRNRMASDVTSAVARDYFRNVSGLENGGLDAYNGLTGREVGQLTAELARTGRIGQEGQNVDQSVQAVRDMTQTVRALKKFFKGDIADLIDQVNSLSGTDFNATFSRGASMLRNMEATGFATGHTNSQMLSLANMSAQISNRAGVDAFSSIANATTAAGVLGSMRVVGGDTAFTQEARVRSALMGHVEGTNRDITARNLSGAYASLVGAGRSDEEARAILNGLDPSRMSAEDIAQAAGTDAGSLLRLSYTREAEEFRASGGANQGSLRRRFDRINSMRRASVTRMLRQQGIDPGSVNVKGAYSIDNIRAALEAAVGGRRAAEMTGELTRLFHYDAEALEFGNAFEADRVLNTVQNRDFIDLIQEQAGVRVDFQAMTEGQGTIGGLRSLSRFVHSASSEGASAQLLWRNLTGDVNFNITDPKYQKMSSRRMNRFRKGLTDVEALIKRTGGAQGAVMNLGLSRVMQALVTGNIGDRQATGEEIEAARSLLMSGADPEEVLREFAGKVDKGTVDGLMREQGMLDILSNDPEFKGQAVKDANGKVIGTRYDEESRKAAARRYNLQARASMLSDLGGKYSSIKDGGRFSKTLEAYRNTLEGARGDVSDELDSLFKSVDTKTMMSRKEFERAMETESYSQGYNLGGTGATKTNNILESIFRVLQSFQESYIGG